MRVANDTLIVKTGDEFYEAERHSGKCCTVRLVEDPQEWFGICDMDPTYIEVRKADDETEGFRRTITWMGQVGELLGQLLVVIVWEERP